MNTPQSRIQFLAYAAVAARLLKMKHLIPCHYGTMPVLSGTPQRLRELTADLDKLEIHILQPGEAPDTAVVKARNH